MGRNRLPPARTVTIRVQESLWAEVVLLKPELQSPISGYTRYGAISSYISQLIREDIEKVQARLREQAERGECVSQTSTQAS